MKSSFLFIRLCVLVSILASGTLIFLLLRAIYYPRLSILLLLVLLLCHLVTTEYKKTHNGKEKLTEPPRQLSIPPDVKKALAIALGTVASLLENKKSKLTESERKQLVAEREALLSIAHFFESVDTMRGNLSPLLEHRGEVTSLAEIVVNVVEARRATFLKKGIVLFYRTPKLKNEYITIDQKHLKRIIETLLKRVAERNISGRVTLSLCESAKMHTVSFILKVTEKKPQAAEKTQRVPDAQYTTLKHMIEHYGGTIIYDTEQSAVWTTCTCTFPSHT